MERFPRDIKIIVFRLSCADGKEQAVRLACVCKDFQEVIASDVELRSMAFEAIEMSKARFFVSKVSGKNSFWRCRTCYHLDGQHCNDEFFCYGTSLQMVPCSFFYSTECGCCLGLVCLPWSPFCCVLGTVYMWAGTWIECWTCFENKCSCKNHACCEVYADRELKNGQTSTSWVRIEEGNCNKCRVCW